MTQFNNSSLCTTIRVVDGKVTSLVYPVIVNTMCGGTVITRQADDTFICVIDDVEHDDHYGEGTLDEVLKVFHPDIAEKYRAVISMVNPTQESVGAVLSDFEIITHS